jgi:hypothetical protein
MRMTLEIAVEQAWHGAMLESVEPVATFPLQEDPSAPGLLSIGAEQPLDVPVTGGVTVWCAVTALGRFIVEIKVDGRTFMRTDTAAPPTSQLRLPDNRLYQISVRHET